MPNDSEEDEDDEDDSILPTRKQRHYRHTRFFTCAYHDFRGTFRHLSVLVMFWANIMILTPLYLWTFVLMVRWTNFLPFAKLHNALFAQFFALLIGIGIVPYALPLEHWNIEEKKLKVLHSLACAISIGCAISAIVLIDNYKEKHFIWHEYRQYINDSLNRNEFPLNAALNVFTQHCCGWTGPLDFGITFDLSNFIANRDIKVMEEISTCYDGLFKVTKDMQTGFLIFTKEKDFDLHKLQDGCGDSIIQESRTACYFIASVSSVAIFLTLLTALFYTFTKNESSEVNKVSPLQLLPLYRSSLEVGGNQNAGEYLEEVLIVSDTTVNTESASQLSQSTVIVTEPKRKQSNLKRDTYGKRKSGTIKNRANSLRRSTTQQKRLSSLRKQSAAQSTYTDYENDYDTHNNESLEAESQQHRKSSAKRESVVSSKSIDSIENYSESSPTKFERSRKASRKRRSSERKKKSNDSS